MTRISDIFQKAQNSGDKILSIFVTAGYPKLDSTPDIVWELEKAGADMVEVGIPFSDPMADGPTIQRSSQVALQNGMNVKLALQQVRTIREQSEIPIILMGYLNPFLKYGFAEFVDEAESVGVDGLIIPDLLPEEMSRFAPAFDGKKIGIHLLISPNSNTERIRYLDRLTRDFIYCVSVTGVTGCRHGMPAGLAEFLMKLQRTLSHPFLVGFGISTPSDARTIAKHAHGVIVGSAVVNILSEYPEEEEMHQAVRKFVQSIKRSLRGCE